MATDHNFKVKNGLSVGTTEVINSSRQLGNIPAAAFGQAISAMDTTNLDVESAGHMSVRGGSYLYFGITSNNHNSWKNRITGFNTSTLHINAQGLQVDNTGYSNTPTTWLKANNSEFSHKGNTIWHAGNDGASSGLDADTLDGQHGSYYRQSWPAIDAGTRENYTLGFRPTSNNYAGFYFSKSTSSSSASDAGYLLVRGTSDTGIYTAEGITLVADAGWLTLAQRTSSSKGVRIMSGTTSSERLKITTAGDIQFVNGNSFTYGGNTIWHAGNDGSTSGLDADLLDGLHESSFLRSDASDTYGAYTLTLQGVVRSTNNANADGPNFNVSTTNKDTAEYAYRVDRSGTIKGGVTINGVFKSFTGVDLTPDSSAYLNFHRGGFVTFYGNSNSHHGIGSRDITGAQSDDLRINSYADVIINLDSNSNNSSNADLIIGRHGGGTSTVTQLHRISGEQGTSSNYIGSSATYSKPLLEITTSTTPTQIKITTNILYSGTGSSTHAHSVTIRGFQYGSAQMADLQIGWHVYNNEFYNRNVVSSGSWAPTVTLAVENNKVVIHLASPGYWPKLYVESMYNAYGGSDQAIGWSWSDAAISADSNTPNQTVPYKNDFGNNVKIDSSGNFKVGNSTVITSSRELQNLHGFVRSDSNFAFLTMSGNAQNIRTKSVFAGTSYGDTPPAGSFNATNTYELNGTTVIDSSRNLVNIGTITATGYLRTSSNGIYGKMSDEWHTSNALRGGNFSADIGNDTTVLTLFPASHLDESGNARAADDYSTGIKFMHLDPDYSTWGSSYGGGQAWIGLKVESTPGQEFSSFVIATNSSSTAGTMPTERLTVSKEGRVTINNVNDAYNFKALAGDTDSWFGVYDDANNSANIIVTRSDTTTSFLHKGHNGETTIAGITQVQRDVRSAGQVRATGWWNEAASTDYTGFAYEIGVSGGTAFALAYNRDTDSYGNMQFNANNFEFNNPVKINDGSNISMDANANGQLEIVGNGYVGAISLDGSNMNIYHNSANRGLVLGVNEAARLQINTDGDVNIFHSESIYGATRWYVSQSDSAHQRVDVRDESTAGRAHWYGVLSDGSTSNFRHAWYTGTGYINIDANTSGIVFGGPVVANELSVPGVVTLGNTTTTPAADLRLYGTGNNYLRFRGTAGNDFEVDLQGTSATGTFSFNQFNVAINNSGTLACGPITVTSASANMNGLVMGSGTQSNYTNIILYTDSGNGQMWKNGSSGTTWGGTTALNIYNSNGPLTFHPSGTANVVKIASDGLHLAQSGDYISLPADGNYAKLRFYGTDSSYAIGMISGQTYGGLNDWAMTFRMNDNSNRGFKWMDSAHNVNQGAMALTTQGKLTVANSIRVGYGESDTTAPGATYGLDVNGHGWVAGRLYAQDGLLRVNRRINTSQKAPIGHFTEGEQVFALDTTWTNEELQAYFNNSNVSWSAQSDAPGGYAVYINGNVNVGGVYNSGFPYIPIDQDDEFYMECWIKNAGTDQRHYMGSNEFNQSFSSLGGNPGSYGYWVMSNTNPGSSWTKVTGYIGGFSNNVGDFETGTKYWTPQALFNYSAGTGTRACYISGWKVIRVRHPGNRVFSGNIALGSGSNTGILKLKTYDDAANEFHLYNYNDDTFRINYNGSGGDEMIMTSTGSVTFTGNVTAYSDERLKENIETLDGSKVLQMRGVSFIKDGEAGSGVIAQELEKVAPELVSEIGDFKSVSYGNLTGYLIEAVKLQQQKIEKLEELVEKLISEK